MLYPSAKIIIKHPDDKNKILLIYRRKFYEPAGGRVEVNFKDRISESLEKCAIREVHEELGLHVSVDEYVGNYYFFWENNPSKFNSCTVFSGSIISIDSKFTTNADASEIGIESRWVHKDDILDDKLPINPYFIGLKELLIDYCSN